MGLKLRRKSVYVATIVAMVAMVAGFALAASLGSLTFSPNSANGSGGSATLPSGTIYAGSVGATSAVYTEASTGCTVSTGTCVASGTGDGCTGASGTYTISAAGTDDVFVGASGTCTLSDEFAGLEVKSTGPIPANALDNFVLSVSGGQSAPFSVSISIGITAAGGTEDLTIWVDLGAANPGYTTIGITVTGS
jgi:hypothetical protein